jgi:hypothetical protein
MTDDLLQALLRELSPVELLRIVPLDEGSRLSSVSRDTIKRRHPDKIVKLSDRREGIRVVDALMLRNSST